MCVGGFPVDMMLPVTMSKPTQIWWAEDLRDTSAHVPPRLPEGSLKPPKLGEK